MLGIINVVKPRYVSSQLNLHVYDCIDAFITSISSSLRNAYWIINDFGEGYIYTQSCRFFFLLDMAVVNQTDIVSEILL